MLNQDSEELEKFNAIATSWWDPQGPLKLLHRLNPIRVEWIRRHLPLAGKKAVDIGCGGGILSESLARQGAQVTGIDLASEVIQVARLHAQAQQLLIDYQEISAEAFAQTHSAQFDLVTCLEMLEHVPNPDSILEASHHLLKPGGWLVLSTINRTLMAYGLAVIGAEYVLNLLPQGTHDYRSFIRPSELVRALQQHGFSVVTLTGLRYNPLTQHVALCDTVAVNYLVIAKKHDSISSLV